MSGRKLYRSSCNFLPALAVQASIAKTV